MSNCEHRTREYRETVISRCAQCGDEQEENMKLASKSPQVPKQKEVEPDCVCHETNSRNCPVHQNWQEKMCQLCAGYGGDSEGGWCRDCGGSGLAQTRPCSQPDPSNPQAGKKESE